MSASAVPSYEEPWRKDARRPTGYVVLASPAELDLSNASRFLTEVLAHDPDHEIVIDLSTTTFCDSTGIGALLSALRHVETGRGVLTLRRPTPSVRRVLDVTQVSAMFTMED